MIFCMIVDPVFKNARTVGYGRTTNRFAVTLAIQFTRSEPCIAKAYCAGDAGFW